MRIRPDPDPKHWFGHGLVMAIFSEGFPKIIKRRKVFLNKYDEIRVPI